MSQLRKGKILMSTQRKWREKRAMDTLLGREAEAEQRVEGLRSAAEAAGEEANDALAHRRQAAATRRNAAAARRNTPAGRTGPKMFCLSPNKQ